MAKNQQLWCPHPEATFVALDFETADRYPDSACAIGLVRVERGEVRETLHRLIRPPRKNMENSWVHGISWAQVAYEPGFEQVWRDVRGLLDGAEFIAAHNAGFDKKVLNTCLVAVGEPEELRPFQCTVKLARRVWKLPRHNLPSVCDHLQIALKHHDAASDAEACARIVIAAARELALMAAATAQS
jgi:DNA polymerase-3 subunit epsilon